MLERVTGIPVGLWAQATVDPYRDILILTPAGTNQDQLPVLIGSSPKMPDPKAALLDRAEDRLARADDGIMAIACNTVDCDAPISTGRIRLGFRLELQVDRSLGETN